MKLKVDENGHVVVQDGKPVYVHEDGKEVPFDAPQAMAKIGSLNAEAKQHREAKDAAEAKLKAFEGIDDAQAAKQALETVKNLEDKKLVDAGEVEKLKEAAAAAWQNKLSEAEKAHAAQLAEAKAETEKIRTQFHGELLGGAFARSQVVQDKLVIPHDVAQAFFGRHFSVSADGKIIAKDAAGNEMYSRIHAGELAGFDEALESLIDAYPGKDSILKGSGASGAGTSAGGASGGKTMPRAAFEKLDPASQMKTLSDGVQVV